MEIGARSHSSAKDCTLRSSKTSRPVPSNAHGMERGDLGTAFIL